MNEIHTLIIWSDALSFKDAILEELIKKFRIKRCFTIHWDAHLFQENLSVFYAHSQYHLSAFDYDKLLKNKIQHCGSQDFFLVVIEDEAPNYENRHTSSGERSVNSNLFDLKQKFRKLTGGGHRIHTSDNIFESNKDLTVLLSKNIEDFNKSYEGYNSEEIHLNCNCMGVNGFLDLSHFFYLLNNTSNYCVLRNFDQLLTHYNAEGHGDIDLLVENESYIKYLVHAVPVYPNNLQRVHYKVTFADQDILFDFRYIGDNYYDVKWQNKILAQKKMHPEGFFCPDDTNLFYSLFYHAYIHKPSVVPDYHKKLLALANKIGIQYSASATEIEQRNILNGFLEKNGYQYTTPNDPSVYFNKIFINSDEASLSKYGKKIAQSQSKYKEEIFVSEVFLKDEVISKLASQIIVKNEAHGLQLLKGLPNFPLYISHEYLNEYGIVKMEFIKGIPFNSLYKEQKVWTKEKIQGLILDAVHILLQLNEKNLSHRDIRPENLIVKKSDNFYRLVLIDFGWSMQKNDLNMITPHGLGANFKYGDNHFSDAFSMGKVFHTYLGKFTGIRTFAEKLMMILPEDYLDNSANEKLIELQKALKINWTLKDKLRLTLNNNPHIKKNLASLKRIIKK